METIACMQAELHVCLSPVLSAAAQEMGWWDRGQQVESRQGEAREAEGEGASPETACLTLSYVLVGKL